jgi:uncharacterized protein YdeI (YjbR/CyaY-like superfamily)
MEGRMEVRFFATGAEFRAWLEQHHATADELWVGFYKKASGRPSITWPESVDEALCFGWIDSVRRSMDEVSYRIRFTPRRPRSIWSAVNVRRAEALVEAGRMQPSGLAAFAKRKEDRTGQYSFEQGKVAFAEELEAELRENAKAWDFFQAQASSYRTTVMWWVMSAKRDETRRRRLATLIKDSEGGERISQFRRDATKRRDG